MKDSKIKVLMVEPHKLPKVTMLDRSLDALQKAVSIGAESQGLIEIIPLENNVCLLCNEEGKLIGLEGNRRLGRDIIAGTFYICGDSKSGALCSLSEENIRKYTILFSLPETFTDEEVQACRLLNVFFDDENEE